MSTKNDSQIKHTKNVLKQLLLVLLFALACLCISLMINHVNERKDSGLLYSDGIYEIPDLSEGADDAVYIGENYIFVPNIDYTDIDDGSFTYIDLYDVPYASGVSISPTDGWNDLGPDAVWHNTDSAPDMRIIRRDGKEKICGLYILSLYFEDTIDAYYINIPDANGLVRVYCNYDNLGFLWGRRDEWTPVAGFGSGLVPVLPNQHGYAQVVIAVSTNVKMGNPGLLAMPSVIDSGNSLRFSIIPALWYMVQLTLFAFILLGGFLVSRTFKNRLIFYQFIAIEIFALAYTIIDCNYLALDAYNKGMFKYMLFILLNAAVFAYIDSFFITKESKRKFPVLNIAPMVVLVAALIAVVVPFSYGQSFNTWFPVVPETLFTFATGILVTLNMLIFHYGEESSFFVCIVEVCHVFFCVNAITDTSGKYNIPTYTVFLVIANLTLEFYFTSKYVINSRKLEDTMNNMQILVQQKTARITEINEDLSETNRKLLENEEARKNVLSNVSHDLRTPITAIRGYAEILLRTRDNMSDQQKGNYLMNIIRRCEQMETIISDIVELTRLESNANEFRFTDISVCEMLDEICMMYEADLEGTGKHIELEIPEEDLLFVNADPKKLSRVFENLISNAVNYTYDEAAIKVRAWREGAGLPADRQTVNIEIEDNGIGIPENEIPMIFDRFYRAKNSGQNIKGTGIGLSIVKTILDRHDAKIEVRSTIGKGTVFHITMKAS